MEKLYDTIITVATVNSFLFGLIFLFTHKSKNPLNFLGLFLFLNVGVNLHWLLNDIRLLPFNFSYLIVPFFYIYVLKVLGIFKSKDLLHFIPASLEFIITSFLLIYSNGTGDVFFKEENETFKWLFYFVLPPLYSFVYTILIVRTLKKYQLLISRVLTEIEQKRLYWLVITTLIFMINYALEFFSVFILLNTNLEVYLYNFHAACTLFISFWVIIYGMNQKSLMLSEIIEMKEEAINSFLDKNSNEVKEMGAFADTEDDIRFNAIIQFFRETKIYRNKEISLYMVSELLPYNYREVSKLINVKGNKNFNQFVNDFRVEEAQKLLLNKDFEKFTISAIGEQVGFNSRASFFGAFKNITGYTPLEYKKLHQPQQE